MTLIYEEANVHAPVANSDHSIVCCYPIGHIKPRNNIIKYKKRLIDPNRKALFAANLNKINWNSFYQIPHINQKLDFLQSCIKKLMDQHFPVVERVRLSADRPWVTHTFKEVIRKRQLAYFRGDTESYKNLRNEANRLSKSLKCKFHEKNIQRFRNSDSRKWWSNVKKLMGIERSKSNDHFDRLADSLCSGSKQELVEQIAEVFHQVSSHLPGIPEQDPLLIGTCEVPDEALISVAEVTNKFGQLRINKAPGPDGIPPWILREFADLLAAPYTSLFCDSFRQGLPNDFKFQSTVPIPKKLPLSDISKDLRPIALTPVTCKVLESFPCKQVMQIISDCLDPCQFGNQKGTSTTHALIDLVHFIAKSTDAPGYHVRILFCDYSKAFDLVNHNLILIKLRDLGVPEYLLRWFASFLSYRQQVVKIGEVTSEPKTMMGGAPQGTLTGPLSFLSYINDLTFDDNIKCIKYVDDTSIMTTSNNPESDALQKAADHLFQWSSSNDMRLNEIKTKEMVVSFARNTVAFESILINGTPIEQVDNFKILGVILQNDLKWNTHITTTIKKANKRLFLLAQLKRARIPNDDLLTLYKSFILPVVNYACEVFHSSLTQYLADDLERVQKRALRTITGNYSDNYSVLMDDCRLMSLHEQRLAKCKDLYIKMGAKNHKLYHLLSKNVTGYNLRRKRKHITPKCRTDRFKQTFIPWSTMTFN